MFDILYSEEFWVDVSIFAAGAAIVGAIISAGGAIKSARINAGSKLQDVNHALSKEHGTLSKEHSAILTEYKVISGKQDLLSSEQRTLLDQTKETKGAVQDASKALTAMEQRAITADAERKIAMAALGEEQRRVTQSAKDMGKFAEEFLLVTQRNQELEQTVANLKAQLKVKEQEIIHLRADLELEDGGPELE